MITLTPETIVAGFGIFLALWYLLASIYNRRRGIAVYRWLHGGLENLGSEVSGRWIGSSGSGAQLHVRKTKAPFQELEIIYLLASRELLPLFLVDLLRGKRDRVIVKATLRANPGAELEVVPKSSGLARQMLAEKKRPWEVVDGPHSLQIGGRGGGSEALRAASLPLLEKYGGLVKQVSWAKKAPHLIAILSLDGLFRAGVDSADFYADLAATASLAHQAQEKES